MGTSRAIVFHEPLDVSKKPTTKTTFLYDPELRTRLRDFDDSASKRDLKQVDTALYARTLVNVRINAETVRPKKIFNILFLIFIL